MRTRLPLALAVLGSLVSVAPAAASGCDTARGVRGSNVSYSAVNAAIHASATVYQVPPTVLKAIAWKESNWRQFWSDGRAKVSPDCGIGIMQITGGTWDYYRLAADYRYNVAAGAKVLSEKMNTSSANLPAALKPDDRRVTENWYRAAYRYNGQGTGAESYADSIISLLRTPPATIAPWAPPLAVRNPKTVVTGYRPLNGHYYVARTTGTWSSTLGTFQASITRADYLAVSGRTTTGRQLESDQLVKVSFTVQNTGYAAWTPRRVTLGTYPEGRASRLQRSTWPAPTQPAAVTADTASGARATFSFIGQAANVSTQTSAVETFAPMVDGALPLTLGRAGATWTIQPARAPTARITAAPALVSDARTDSSALVSVSAADPTPGSGLLRVEMRSRQVCGTCAWTAPAAVPATGFRVVLPGAGAHEVVVRAVDRAGHASAWTPARRIVVPRDNSSATLVFDSRWAKVARTSSWLGSVHQASASGAALHATAIGTSWALVGSRGPGLAPLKVYVDGALVATVTTASDTVRERQVLWRGTTTAAEHTVRVVAAGTSGAVARVDALAVS